MSTRSAQPLSHTRRQKAAYSGKAAFARPPSAWVRRVTRSSLSPRTARSPVRQRERAAASRQPANQSARNSMQSAASWANACPCARTACSVSSTIGRMTLGRPCPMTQPRTVMQDIKNHARFLYYIYYNHHNGGAGWLSRSLERGKKICKKGLTSNGKSSTICERPAGSPRREARVEKALQVRLKKMKKVLDKNASRCYNKQVAGQPADERRTLKIEQYRILVTEPLTCIWTLKIPKK